MIYDPPERSTWPYDSAYQDEYAVAYTQGYDVANDGGEFAANHHDRWDDRFWWNTGWFDGKADNRDFVDAKTNAGFPASATKTKKGSRNV